MPKLKALASVIACILAAGQVQANPVEPVVVSGEAAFSTQGSSLNITNSPGAIIHWQGFSIGAGETTRFEQQSAASSVLNRVTGSDPSSIFGALSSNGQVYLINPSGVLFGHDARIDVAGLVASTLNLSDEDFRAGRLNFQTDPLAGNVSSHGRITTPTGGNVYLVGTNVTNGGLISSPQGDVILAAGQTISISDSSAPGVRVELSGDTNTAVNLGEILARSGEVGIYGAALRNGGSIDADQVVRDHSGRITLRASGDVTLTADSQLSADGDVAGTINIQSDNGTTLAEGSISARGTDANSRGGNIHLLGNRVGLLDVGIDASGVAGGGTVLVGGDYKGGNQNVRNAASTYAGAAATIRADALTQGDGGKVILWADDFTRFLGTISARGGIRSGDGGFVETSGKLNLEVLGGGVDTSAAHGQAGTWLLDPSDVNVTTGVTTGSFVGGIFTPNQDTAILNNTVVSTALQTGNVNITTTNATGTQAGRITVSAPITRSAGTGTTTLTLTPNQTSGGTITIAGGGNISGSAASPLNVVLAANGVGATVAVGAPITTFGGAFTSTGTTFTNAGGAIDTSGTGTGGNITLTHTETMTIDDPLTSGGGNISIAGGSTYTGAQAINAGTGTVTLRGSADSLAIGIGSTSGTYNISQAQIANITTTGGLIFGHSSGTGAITLGTDEAVNFGTKNVLVQQATGGITVTGSAISGSGSISFVAGTGTFLNNSQVITNGAVNITADLLALNADIVGTGQLTLAPFTQSLAIGVGVAPTRVDFGGNNFITTAVASNSGRTLKIGGSNHTGGITVIGAYNPLSARLELVTGGQMTINAAGTVTSPNIALAGSNFSNAAGAAALVASGRWLVYSADPALNTFGGLNSGNLAQWGRTYVANPPSTISATGNRYVFSKVPQMTATLAIGTVNKIYGTDLTGSTPAVNISGLVDAATYGNVFLQDSSGGTATTSSAGYAPTAAVNNSVPYAVSISGITAPDGYGPIITNDGEVIVAPYVVNLNGTRTYDGTVNMPAANLGTNALIGTQTLTLTGTGTVANRNVGAGKALTPGSLALGNGSNGGLAANYTLTGGTHAASITQAPVTFGTNNVSKVYDGTLTAAGATVIRSGAMFGGDTFSGGNFAFTNKNVGAGNKSVSTSGVSVNDGNGGGNYSISYELNTSSTISPYVVSLNGSRTYDGTVNMPAANLGTNALVGTETLTLTGTGTVASRNVGAGKALTPGSLALGNGSNGGLASNYTLTGGTHAASITQAPVTFGTNDVSKVYDGTLTAAGAAVIRSGAMFGGDTFSGGNFAFTDKNVGAGNKTVTTGGVSVNDGNGGGNYSVSYALNTSSTISPYVVSLTGSRRYDGTANFLAADLTMSTLVGAETLTLAGTGTVANADIATGKALTLGTLALGNGSNGGLASNYTLTGGTHLASIVGALLGITANDATRTYNGLAWNGGNGVTYSGFLPGDSEADLSGTLVFSGTSQGAVNVGNYSIIPSGLSSGTYTIEFISGNLSITPATLGIAANSAINVYNGLGWSGGNGATYTGFQDNDTAADLVGTLSYGGTSQGAVNVGTYSILASGQSSPNYTITYTNGNLVIAPAALSIIADSTSKTYGDTVSFIGTEFRSSGLKNGETIGRVSLASSGAHPLASVHGSPYEIIPHNARDGSFKPTNYTITYFNGKLTVLPAGLLGVTANSVVNVYNGVPWSGGSGVTYTGFQGDDTVADLDGTLVYGGSSQGAVDVGTYSIVPSGLSSTNYTISYIDGSLIITPATLGIVANNRSKNFGSTVTFTGNEFSSSGLQNNETIGSVTLTSAGAAANASVADSPYTIVPGNALGGSFNPANYTISYIDGSLEVIPVGLLGIAANSVVKVYNGLTWTGGNGVTYSGFKGNDTAASLTGTLSYGGTSQGAVDVGNYSIVPFGQSSPNYTITYTSGNLAITPAPLDIAALDISKNYGTALDFTGDEFSSSGLQNGETIGTVTLTSTGTVASASVANGPYTIVATNATGGSFNPANYTIGYTNGNLSVSPVPLMVTADPRTKLIGTPDPALTFSVTGLVNNAQLGVVDTAASVLSGALMRAPGETVAGNPYPINRGSLVANSNYTLDFTPANLLITAADVVVPGPGPGIAPAPIIFSGLIHNVFYHRPGNFWHISLNASGADFGFDVLRGTGTEETRLRKSLNRCDSVSGRGFCETWAFPQQQDNGQ